MTSNGPPDRSLLLGQSGFFEAAVPPVDPARACFARIARRALLVGCARRSALRGREFVLRLFRPSRGVRPCGRESEAGR